MTKTDTQRGAAGAEAVLNSMEQGRQEAAHAWSRACQLYAHYFANLGKAETPAAIMQANADLVSESMENWGRSLSAFQQISTP